MDLVKPFLPILPEVESPLQKVDYQEKLAWTATIGFFFFLMSEVPLYGVTAAEVYDPLYWLRPILASTKGSLMEIGISPIITSGIIMQILGGLQIIDVNYDFKSDRDLFQSAQKLLAMLLSVVQTFAIIFSGLYGSPFTMTVNQWLLLVLQLFAPSMFLIFSDEIMQKGYSWGTGASFFLALKVAQEFLWRALSFQTNDFGRGKEFTGSIVAFVHSLFTRSFKNAIVESFYRTHLPNLFETYTTLVVLIGTVYLLSVRIDLPIKSTKVRSPASSYRIRLLYTSGMPLLFVAAIVSNLFLLSQALFTQFPDNLLVRLFGTWAVSGQSDKLTAISGLAYYMSPPVSFISALWDPIKTVVYALLLVVSCAAFSRSWSDISGDSPKDVAKTFKNQGIVIVGHRDVSVVKELRRVIPVAASVGGAVVAGVSIVSDLAGACGMGAASITAVCIVYSYFEILAQEGGIPGGFIPGSQ